MQLSAAPTARIDAVLDRAVDGSPRVPGVVAALTDRDGEVYVGARGVRSLADPVPMDADTVFAIFSVTKAFTTTLALVLAESGELDLDAPAHRHAPELDALGVLDGWEASGAPRLRPPRVAPTTRMLLAHTAGLGYAFFNEAYARLTREGAHPPVASATRASLMTPLLFEPGSRWEYGSGVDWAGRVIEGVTGERLGEAMGRRLLEPLGMRETTFAPGGSLRARRAALHRRSADGGLQVRDAEPPTRPELDMGGQGLFSTVSDCLRLLRMWLCDGAGPAGPILRPETVRMAAADQIAPLAVRRLPGVIPGITHELALLPGVPTSWALGFLRNEEAVPGGRSAGSLGWAGLANLHYWIDRARGIGGLWATQLLPFLDPTALAHARAFERAAYREVGPAPSG